MKNITVNKEVLISILKVNKNRHTTLFIETWNGYREDVRTWLDDQLILLEDGKEFETMFPGDKPASYEDNYTRIIGMLEMDIDKEVELNVTEYENYVEDNWNWKQHFTLQNSTYSKV